ncbi:MAG: cell division protein ZapA [Rhodocyclaceae bacterium]|jgi:cell division protein ZapA|nr:cell division protein ZapA [Rhodocyclaceae bacterium]
MSANPTLDIKLQGRAYSVACPPEEREALLEAVALLDGKMDDLAKKTRSTGERLAVMVALNLAHELTALRKSPTKSSGEAFDTSELRRRIQAMEARLDAAVAQQEDLF